MSRGAIFKLVLRDERFDRFFQASDFLRARLDAVRARRRAAGEPNPEPTFADIERTHLLYVHAAYRPYVSVASEYTRVQPSGDGTAWIGPSGGTLEFTFPTYGHFTSDIGLHLKFKAIGTPVDERPIPDPTPERPLLNYCAYPGIRALKRVTLKSDAVIIDEYTADDVVAHSKFFVSSDQRTGWDRCHGQQSVDQVKCFIGVGEYTGVFHYCNGPQTLKYDHPDYSLFIPLQFWFCRDAAQALLNDLIPNSQRTITIELAPIDQIIQAQFYTQVLPGLNIPYGYKMFHVTPLPFTRLAIEASLYVNNLYVNPEIYDIFASRIGFSLVHVHRQQVYRINTQAGRVLLDQLKFPTEYLMVGFRDRLPDAATFDTWWLMGDRQQHGPPFVVDSPGATLEAAVGVVISSPISSIVESLSVTAHGVEIFPQLPAVFYNAYMPIRYGGNSLVKSPTDSGAFMVNFCLYPGKFTPSGYYNLSAGRELYIEYELKDTYADVPTDMVVSASALNFLIRKGDTCYLKYAL